MTKFTIEDLRDIAYRGSYDDLERELALQLLASMEQTPVYLRPFGDDGETFVACDGDDERAITLYAAPQLTQPAVGNEFLPKNLDRALGVLGMALPESREEFNLQQERWIQRLIDRVIRCADELAPQPALPGAISTRQAISKMEECEPCDSINVAYKYGWNACRAAMLQGAGSVQGWIPCSERMPDADGNYWGWWSESKRQGPVWFIKSELQAQFQSSEITHWMPLPACPKGE